MSYFTQVTHDENNLPSFEPGYTMRITGEVRELSMEEISFLDICRAVECLKISARCLTMTMHLRLMKR